MPFAIHSPSFEHNGEIPPKYTCHGENISPPLVWSDPPPGTIVYALIVDDPDAPDPAAPKMTWVRWILYNIPVSAHELPEGVSSKNLPAGTEEGISDFHTTGYGGPCPPIGRHRYFFKLYALSKKVSGLNHPVKSELEQAMAGSILAQTELVGTSIHP